MPDNGLEGYSLNYYKLVRLAQSPIFRLFDPQDHQRLDQIFDYFNTDLDHSKSYDSSVLEQKKNETLFNYSDDLEITHLSLYEGIPDIEFIKPFLNKPDGIKKLKTLGIYNECSEKQIMEVLQQGIDHPSAILPRSIHYLKQLSILCWVLLDEEKKSSAFSAPFIDFEFKLSVSKHSKNHLRLLCGMGHQKPLKIRNLHDQFFYAYQFAINDDYSQFRSCFCEKTSQNKLISEIDDEYLSDLGHVGLDSLDELIRALDFYQSQPTARLARKHAITSHLFRPNRLLKQIISEPKVAQKLFDFIQYRFSYFQVQQAWDDCLFWCDIGERCVRFIKWAQKEHPEISVSAPNYRQVVLQEILPNCQEKLLRAKIYDTLAQWHATVVDDEPSDAQLVSIAKDLLTDSLYLPLVYVEGYKPFDDFASEQKDRFFLRVLPNIQKLLNENLIARKQILDHVASQILGRPVDEQWAGISPFFTTSQFKVDLDRFTFTDGGKVLAHFSKKISNMLIFNELVSKISQAVSLRNDVTALVTAEGKYWIKWDGHNTDTMIIEHEIDEKNYLLVLENEFREKLPEFLALDHDAKFWFCLETQNPHYILEAFDKSKYYIDLKKVSEFDYEIISIAADNERKKLLVDQEQSPTYEDLAQFEDPDFIKCWYLRDQPQIVKEIEFPRYGLKFRIVSTTEGEKAFYVSDQNSPVDECTGFFIAEDQLHQFKDQWPRYLVLTNANHKSKVLMPHLLIKRKMSEAEEAYAPELSIKINENKNSMKDWPIAEIFQFEVEEVDGKIRLKAASASEALYLFYICLCNKHYQQAHHYLQKAEKLSPYTIQDRNETLNWIFAKPNDDHPSAVVLRLLLTQMVQENTLKYVNPNGFSFNESNIEADLVRYSSNYHNTTLAKLSTYQEKFLLSMSSWKDRFQWLDSPQDLDFIVRGTLKKKEGAGLAHCVFNHFLDLLSKKGSKMPLSQTNLTFDQLKGHFGELYQIAKEGTADEKKKLKQLLDFQYLTIHNWNDPQYLITVLYAILDSPHVFPHFHEIKRDEQLEKRYDEFMSDFRKRHNEQKLDNVIDYALMPKKQEQIKKTGAATPRLQLGPSDAGAKDKAIRQKLQKQLSAFFDSTIIPHHSTKTEDDKSDKQLHKYVREFDQLSDQIIKKFALQPNKDLGALITKLAEYYTLLEEAISESEQEILDLGNSLSPTQIARLAQVGRLKKRLSLNQILALFEQGQEEEYKQATFLTAKGIEQLEAKIEAYTVVKARLDQLHRILENLANFQSVKELAFQRSLIQKIGEELEADNFALRVEDEQLRRTLLIFQCRNKLLLHQKQVDILKAIFRHKNPLLLLAQLGTGSGKSKVLAQLKQWLRRKIGILVFNAWPASLYPVNKMDTQSQVSTTFGQRADTLEFNRVTPSKKQHLKFIEDELGAAQKEKRQLNTTPENIQSIQLKFLELLRNYSESNDPEILNSIYEIQKILNRLLISEVHVDEGHDNMSVKKLLNYSAGQPGKEPEKNILLMEELFRTLLSTDEMKKLINLQKTKKGLITKVLFDENAQKKFNDQAIPLIIEHFVKYLEISHTPELEKEFSDYVQGHSTTIPAWVRNHPKCQEICLLRGQLTYILKECLKANVNVNFGRSKLHPEIEYVKPYAGNDNCVEPADFFNIHEAINKTFLNYLYLGLDAKQQENLIQHLQKQALGEADQMQIEITETAAFKFFEKEFPQNFRGKLFTLTGKDIEKESEFLNKNHELILYYVTHIIAPSIKKFPANFKSDPQNFRSMFGSAIFMTATPGSKHIYGPEINFISDALHDERVMETLSRKCADPSSIHVIDAVEPSDLLDEALKLLLKDNSFRMLIDIGAYFKGISNRQVAEKLLSQFSSVNPVLKGIVFFENDELMVLELGKATLFPLDQCRLPLEQRFAYCDQKHIFGADIKLHPIGKGLATYDYNTDVDSIKQGAGRLREILQGQSIEWVLTAAIKQSIAPSHTITFEMIKTHSAQNQKEKESHDNYEVLYQQMRNEVRKVMIRKLIAATSDIKKLYQKFEPFLLETYSQTEEEKSIVGILKAYRGNLYDTYGQIEVETSGVNSLKEYRDELIGLVKKMKTGINEPGFSDDKADELLRILHAEYEDRINSLAENLPQKINKRHTDIGIACEVQRETEVNQSTQTQNSTTRPLRKTSDWPLGFDLLNWNNPQPIIPQPKKEDESAPLVSRLQTTVDKIFMPLKATQNWLSAPNIGYASRFFRYSLGVVAGIIILPVALAITILTAPLWLTIGITLAIMDRRSPLDTRWSTKRKFKKIPLKPTLDGAPSCFQLSQILKVQPNENISNAASLFTSDKAVSLESTSNFLPENSADNFIKGVKPLSIEQKPLYEVLVIQDELTNGENELKIVIGDMSTDSHFWRTKLAEDKVYSDPETAGLRKRKMCVYDLHLGIVQDSLNAFKEEELQTNQAFQEMIVKLRLYNGDSVFKEGQLEYLKSLVSLPETKGILKNFMKEVFVWHTEKALFYSGSPLEKLLEVG